jgi:cation transport ATPase
MNPQTIKAITVAFVASWGASLGLLSKELDVWWELALLIVIMLLGHWLEMRSLAQTSSALESLAALLPDEAEKVEGDRLVAAARQNWWSATLWRSPRRTGAGRRRGRRRRRGHGPSADR